jgi:hypothetical protein
LVPHSGKYGDTSRTLGAPDGATGSPSRRRAARRAGLEPRGSSAVDDAVCRARPRAGGKEKRAAGPHRGRTSAGWSSPGWSECLDRPAARSVRTPCRSTRGPSSPRCARSRGRPAGPSRRCCRRRTGRR